MNGAVAPRFLLYPAFRRPETLGRRTVKPDEGLSSVVEKEVELLGFELVRLDMASRGRMKVLRLFIDGPEEGVSVGDCIKVTKAVGFVLEGEELIQGAFNLEVSSPGINRPLVKRTHYERFTGHGARVEYTVGAGEKKVIIGEIARVEEDSVVILSEGKEEIVRFDRIIKASLHGEKWDIGGTKERKKKRTGKSR